MDELKWYFWHTTNLNYQRSIWDRFWVVSWIQKPQKSKRNVERKKKNFKVIEIRLCPKKRKIQAAIVTKPRRNCGASEFLVKLQWNCEKLPSKVKLQREISSNYKSQRQIKSEFVQKLNQFEEFNWNRSKVPHILGRKWREKKREI